MIKTFDFAWLVGLLEGEGCFTLMGSHPNKQPHILLQMTDRDTVARAAKILGGKGFITERIRKAHHATYGRKIIYRYDVGSSLAIFWMEILLPHMSNRRQEQIKYIISFYKSKPRRKLNIKTIFPEIERIA